jgi:predicted Holliday junction resolvase-like endonuclease
MFNPFSQLTKFVQQQNQINNLNSQINDLQRRISTNKEQNAVLSKQSEQANVSKQAAFNTSEDWKRKINGINEQTTQESTKLAGVNSQIDKIIPEINYNVKLLNTGNDEQQIIIKGGQVMSAEYTSNTIQNIDVNNKYYNDMRSQNHTMFTTINNRQNELTTYDKKTTNEYNNISRYSALMNKLLYTYYVVLLVLFYFIYAKNYISNKYALILLFIILCTYPLYILKLETMLYEYFTYYWALIRGEPHSTQ